MRRKPITTARTLRRANYVSLCCGITALFIEIADHETEALIDGKLTEQLLSAKGVADEGRRHQIGQHFRVAQVGEITIDFGGKLPAAAFELFVEIENLGAKRFAFEWRFRGLGFERLDLCDAGRGAPEERR